MNGTALVARLRRLAVLRAEADLAARRAAEADAARAEAEAAAAIAREIAAGCTEPDADAFTAWLAAARRARDQARTRTADAARAVLQARAQLVSAESAQAAIDGLIKRHTRAATLRAVRAEQVVIDDWAGLNRPGV